MTTRKTTSSLLHTYQIYIFKFNDSLSHRQSGEFEFFHYLESEFKATWRFSLNRLGLLMDQMDGPLWTNSKWYQVESAWAKRIKKAVVKWMVEQKWTVDDDSERSYRKLDDHSS